MKTPDKIYVVSYNGEAISYSWTIEPRGDITATEYIRKDALLEWAKESRDSLGRLSYGEFIDKLNSI